MRQAPRRCATAMVHCIRGDEIAFVEPEPHVEISGLLADGDMRLRDDRAIQFALRQHSEISG